jgi:hypothetical protein
MPFNANAFLKPFIKQASKMVVDFGQHVIREGLIAKAVPIPGLSATSNMRYFVASSVTALTAAFQAYNAKGGRIPYETLAAGAALGTSDGGSVVLPVDPGVTGDSVLVVVPKDMAQLGERMLAPCGFRKVAFLRTRYQPGQRGRRVPQEIWAWVGQ